ncbi:hypothetical protein QE152_g31006 [Popillia japonica]|uniref:Uncharacterized protein n=1 Tax=Popillia japonica TaxID=7064 RepID=A0AAW1JCM2_POPJA
MVSGVREGTRRDETLRKVGLYVLDGWPEKIPADDDELKQYAKYKEDIVMQGGILFKGNRVIVPRHLRIDMLKRLHAGHSARVVKEHKKDAISDAELLRLVRGLSNDHVKMGANVSRHSSKGLSGRRTQSSGSICNGKGGSGGGGRHTNSEPKICGSLPSYLDERDATTGCNNNHHHDYEKPPLQDVSICLDTNILSTRLMAAGNILICLNLDDLDIAWDMEGGLRSSIMYPIAFGLGAKCLTNYPPKYPPITYYQARD